MRRRRIVIGIAGTVMIGLSACASEQSANEDAQATGPTVSNVDHSTVSSGVRSTTASADQSSVLTVARSVVARLGPVGDITSVTVGNASADSLKLAQRSSGVWISLTSSASTDVDTKMARWISGIIVGEVWKRRHDIGDDSVAGGDLASMEADPTAEGSGTTLAITPDVAGILFTSSDPGTPSKLTVSDQGQYESSVAKAAKVAGLTVSSIKFTQSLGTVVQVDELATDPESYVKQFGTNNPGLTLDPNDVEGVFLVVQDSDGDVVAVSAWSTASKSGEGGVGDKYADLVGDNAGTTPTSSPSPASS